MAHGTTGEFTAEAAPYPARGRGCIRSVLTLKQRLSLWFARTYETARGTPASPSGHSSAARCQFPKSAAASYVLCRNSKSVSSGIFSSSHYIVGQDELSQLLFGRAAAARKPAGS